MCETCVRLRLPDRDVRTMGELRALWPVLVRSPRYNPGYMESAPDDSCVCPVDIEASADANGARVRKNYAGDYTLNV